MGRKLAERVIEDARDLGYDRMRLDTIASKMGDTVGLYRVLGFREISAYCDSPFPAAVFMELSLR